MIKIDYYLTLAKYERLLVPLKLWKDADPGIAELEDAKERLAGVKRQ